MNFYVIGNGFDLHYGLPTNYSSFKKFILQSCSYHVRETVQKVDCIFRLFWEPYRYDTPAQREEMISNWSELEDMLTVFNRLDAEEILQEAFDNSEQDDERADYFDSPAWNVRYLNDYIKILKDQFEQWILSMDVSIVPDGYFCPEDDDFILSFNYTKTIEDTFKELEAPVLHIHGVVGENLILGHNQYEEPDLFRVSWDMDSDYRATKANETVNEVLKEASVLYFKNSEKIIQQTHEIWSRIGQCEKVIIMGLSCGDQDYCYIEEILQYAHEVEFYYYKEDDSSKDKFRRIVGNRPIHVRYIPW